jgi:DNA-binding protein
MSRSPTIKEAATLRAVFDPKSDSYGNYSKSAKKVYKITNPHSADQIGYEVKQRLEKGLIRLERKSDLSKWVKENLTEEYVLSSLLKLSMGESPKKEIKLKGSDITKAVELLAKYRAFNGLLKDTQTVENVEVPPTEEELDNQYIQLTKTNDNLT